MKVYAIKDLFGIQVIVIKIVILVNIQTIKVVNTEKNQINKLIDERTESIEEVKLAETTPFENKNKYEYNSCKVYIISIIAFFAIFTGITIYLVYLNWSLINNYIKFSTHKKNKKLDECNYIKWIQQSK